MAIDPEQQANELHHQPVDHKVAWLLVAFFLLLITLRPLLLLCSPEVRQIFGRFAAALEKVPEEAENVRQANRKVRRAIADFDGDLEKNSRFSERLQPIWHQALAELGSGHETVHVGYGGWLEYRPAFEYVTGEPILDPPRLGRWPDADPRPALLKLKADLELRGIALWLLPAPSKVMVHPEGFVPGLLERGAAGLEQVDNPSFAGLRGELEAAGIRVFDPLPELRRLAASRPVYFKTDSHWRPEGIDATAAALAAALEAEVPLSPRDQDWRRRTEAAECATCSRSGSCCR